MVPFALGGTALWAMIGLVLLLFRESLARQHRTDWLWICLSGVGFGLAGLVVMLRHDANRRRRRAQP
jgi:hypothetical protein